MEAKWVNQVAGDPALADFLSTGGLGPALVVDTTSALLWTLINESPVLVGADVGWIDATRYGMSPSASADDNDAGFAAAVAAAASLSKPRMFIRPGTYNVHYSLVANVDGLVIDAWGVKFVSDVNVGSPILVLSGDRVQVQGLHILQVNDPVATNPWCVNVTGEQCRLLFCFLEKTEGSQGYQMYVRWGANGFEMIGCRTQGSNGIYNEVSNALYLGNTFIGRAIGGDDSVVMKAIQGAISNIRYIGNHIENLANFIGMGTEIGVATVNDPTHAKAVSNVVILGCTGKNCAQILLIKPGAGAYDYRDGLVENILVDGCGIEDPTGDKFSSGIDIRASRGAIIRNITLGTITIRARANDTEASGHHKGIDIFAFDSATGNSPQISGIRIGAVTIIDPWGGVDNGVGGAPGYPIVNLVNIEDNTAGGNAITDVVIDGLQGDGCREQGIMVRSGVADDQVRIANATIKNAGALGGANQNGIRSASGRVLIGDDVRVAMASTATATTYGTSGTGAFAPILPQQVAASSLIGNATASRAGATEITLAGGLGFSGSTVGLFSPFAISGSNPATATLTNTSGSPTDVPLLGLVRASNISSPTTAGGALMITDHQSNYSLVVKNNGGTVRFYVGPAGNVNTTGVYQVAANQVVGARKTGWGTATGTATRTTFDTASVTLPELAERVKALIDDLHQTAGHGLIGT